MIPKIEIIPGTKVTVTGGEAVTFRCVVKDGVPEPRVEWTVVNNTLLSLNGTYTKENGVLTISPASGQHEGTYVCKATNMAGTVEATTELIVLGNVIQNYCPLNTKCLNFVKNVDLILIIFYILYIVTDTTGFVPTCSNSLIIHQVKTKEIITVTMVWKCGRN